MPEPPTVNDHLVVFYERYCMCLFVYQCAILVIAFELAHRADALGDENL